MDAKEGVMMCKLKGWIDKGGHYDGKGNVMCKLKGWMDKGHYVAIRGWMMCAN